VVQVRLSRPHISTRYSKPLLPLHRRERMSTFASDFPVNTSGSSTFDSYAYNGPSNTYPVQESESSAGAEYLHTEPSILTRLHTTVSQTPTLFKSPRPPQNSLSTQTLHLQHAANVGMADRRGRRPKLRAIVIANLVKAVVGGKFERSAGNDGIVSSVWNFIV
jgi:hypothetical protein